MNNDQIVGAFREAISQKRFTEFSGDKWRIEIYPKQLKDGIYFYWQFRARHSEIDPDTGKRKYNHVKGGRTDKENIPFPERLTEYHRNRGK